MTHPDEHASAGAVANDPLLRARSAGRAYGDRRALAGATLEVRAGEAVALVGPNGAGKSTLLALLAGALAPSEGEVNISARRVGWAPQRPAQYGRLSARENLELFARLERVDEPRAAADRLLRAVDVADDAGPSERLSAGNQQRLNVALALLGDPDVLVLDEPTASLDPRQRARLWELVEAAKARGAAVVFATQNLDEAAHLADRVVALREGELVFSGTAAEYERCRTGAV